jgi:hypothetical protein
MYENYKSELVRLLRATAHRLPNDRRIMSGVIALAIQIKGNKKSPCRAPLLPCLMAINFCSINAYPETRTPCTLWTVGYVGTHCLPNDRRIMGFVIALAIQIKGNKKITAGTPCSPRLVAINPRSFYSYPLP